jgi:hypothetical protein
MSETWYVRVASGSPSPVVVAMSRTPFYHGEPIGYRSYKIVAPREEAKAKAHTRYLLGEDSDPEAFAGTVRIRIAE